MTEMIEIDGAQGEGGGQVLRSSLSLSAMTGRAVHMRNIRAGRSKPGLKRQHLAAARAVAEVCGGTLRGDELLSGELTLEPGKIRGGDYRFGIGSAGSVVLVAQTVIPVLLLADAPSTVVIEGGTHVWGAPLYPFFEEVYLPQLRCMGCEVTAELERYGFVPAGGGAVRLTVTPLTARKPYVMTEAGTLESAEVVALYSEIDPQVARSEAAAVAAQVESLTPVVTVREVDAVCAGNAVYLKLQYAGITELFSAVGSLGVSRREVACRVIKRYQEYRRAGYPVGHYLADQLLLPMLHLGAGGRFRTCPWSLHARTNLEVLAKFPCAFATETRTVDGGIEFEAK